MLSPGCHLPPSTVAFDGALVIPGSANMKSDAKQYLSGALVQKGIGKRRNTSNLVIESWAAETCAHRPCLISYGTGVLLDSFRRAILQPEKFEV